LRGAQRPYRSRESRGSAAAKGSLEEREKERERERERESLLWAEVAGKIEKRVDENEVRTT
jgi:hypothetical protein